MLNANGLYDEATQDDVDDAAVYAADTASVETDVRVIEWVAIERLEDALVAGARMAIVNVDRFDGRVVVQVRHSGVTGTAEARDKTGATV